jgi:hypothetical protein
VKIALEPPAFFVACPDDPRPGLLHLGQLEPHFNSEARNLNCQARRGENSAEKIGTVEQGGLVPEECDFLPSILDPCRGARVIGQVGNDAPDAIGVHIARRQPEEQLSTRVAKRRGKHGGNVLGLSPPLAHVVDKGAHASQPFVAEAVEAPIHRSLRAIPQWSEGGRDHEDGEARYPARTTTSSNARKKSNDGVEEAERNRDERVDERPIDQPIDFIQPIARHSHADRDRDGGLHPEQKTEHGIAGLTEREAPGKERDHAQRDQQRRIGQPEHLQPLDPLRALVATRRCRCANEEACKDGQPRREPQKAERLRPAKRKRIGYVRERLLELISHQQQEHEERHRAGREERACPPPRRGKPAGREDERDRQRPGEEGRPKRRNQRGPGSAGKRSRMCLQRHQCVRRRSEDSGKRERAEEEDPTDRVMRPTRRDERADGGRRRNGSEEERIQPQGAGPGNLLVGSDPIKHQPACDQGDGREP